MSNEKLRKVMCYGGPRDGFECAAAADAETIRFKNGLEYHHSAEWTAHFKSAGKAIFIPEGFPGRPPQLEAA